MSGRADKPGAATPGKATTDEPQPTGFSRRRLLGGALAGTLATVLLGRARPVEPGPNRWTGKTRWIGHC